MFTAFVDWVIFPVITYDINGDGRPDRVFDRNPKNNQQGIYVHLNTGSGFSSGWRWQNDLGDSWKNHPIHKGGKHSTLIDMNGDGRPDRVYDRNPSNDQEGIYVINIYSFVIIAWISVKDTVG
jgi:hypothetical protein